MNKRRVKTLRRDFTAVEVMIAKSRGKPFPMPGYQGRWKRLKREWNRRNQPYKVPVDMAPRRERRQGPKPLAILGKRSGGVDGGLGWRKGP